MPDSQIRSQARRIAKGIWWVVTPWRTKQRLQFLRERAAAQAREAELGLLVGKEAARVELRRRGWTIPRPATLDLFNDEEVVKAVGLPASAVLCAPVLAREVRDRWSAACFCIDFWRRRGDLRAHFPEGLESDGLREWLQGDGRAELGLSDEALPCVLDLLTSKVSEPARQAFLSNDAVNAALPHGLTPIGIRDLLRWLIRRGTIENKLRLEEIWWLLLEAEAHPELELVRAYAFTPSWQQAHPDGLSIFGRDAFGAWLASEYGASGAWLDPARWTVERSLARQIREAYWARSQWRDAWPDAFTDAARAREFVSWLRSPEAGLQQRVRDWCELDSEAIGDELAKPGFNIIGHFCYPSGLRVSAESIVAGARLAGLDVSLRDVRTDAKDDPHHVDFDGMEWHDVTIIHTQPEPFFRQAYQRANLFERSPRTYRIAYWYWEFDSIPDEWLGHASDVDEVWTATEFVAKGMREKLRVPVRTLFPGVKLAPFNRRDKAYFGLREAPFTFLFTFHMMSVMERKNPLGLIQAFKQAFSQEEDVHLVLKTSFGDRHPTQIEELRHAASGANITLIDQVYSPDEVLSLMDACDAYVSLHRSEGLGLTMAEAMLMGKPVIATGFSGNVDFMDESNSLLVPFELVKLGKPIPPYDAELEWAEPSTEHSARLMRRVFENQEWARELGARARLSALSNLSLEAAGRRIACRLAEIRAGFAESRGG